MIIDLPGGIPKDASRREARRALLLIAESLREARPRRPRRVVELEKRRMRDKIRGTAKLAVALRKQARAWEAAFYRSAGLSRYREGALVEASDDPIDDDRADEILAAVEAIGGKDLAQTLYDLTDDAYDRGVSHAGAELKAGAGDDLLVLDDDDAKKALKTRQFDFATSVSDDQKDALRSMLTDAFDDHPTIKELASQIADFFVDGVHRTREDGTKVVMDVDSWSTMVARTEISHAQNTGLVNYYSEAGIERVMWVAAGDACPECQDIDGDVVAIGESFAVGESQPPAHPNCRCTLVSAGDEDGDTDRSDGDFSPVARRSGDDDE